MRQRRGDAGGRVRVLHVRRADVADLPDRLRLDGREHVGEDPPLLHEPAVLGAALEQGHPPVQIDVVVAGQRRRRARVVAEVQAAAEARGLAGGHVPVAKGPGQPAAVEVLEDSDLGVDLDRAAPARVDLVDAALDVEVHVHDGEGVVQQWQLVVVGLEHTLQHAAQSREAVGARAWVGRTVRHALDLQGVDEGMQLRCVLDQVLDGTDVVRETADKVPDPAKCLYC